ncbi:MAG TPA: TonB-dependent receptor [Steroidobacteraceae bacterium]|nr:TonB-dependent receptor [Steroidobacteraceae bacterium]
MEKRTPGGSAPASRKRRSTRVPGGPRFTAGLLLALASLPALAHESQYSSTDSLKRLSLEELFDVEVSSVSKTPEPIGEAAAAVTVVSSTDIERSGATSVPDALRFVPGLHIAHTGASQWAVSSRGFTSVNSEKLLVLSDTRSLYTPLVSGVAWDVQDYVLADIDRIEVIRGPGAALWGSNAVNGVINITTKSARDTQGLYLAGNLGTDDFTSAAARYGGQTDGGVAYRVFGKYTERGASFHSDPTTSDDFRLSHVGFRTDWEATTADAFTVQGDLYHGDAGQLRPSLTVIGRPGPTGDLSADLSGGNVLGRWRRALGPTSEFQVRAYYDHTRRDDPTYLDELDTFDLDLQHRFALGSKQDILWGLSYRYMADRFDGKGSFVGALQPGDAHDSLVSGFVQDQIALGDAVRLTLGTKLEHNDFSGFEVQPSVRAAWGLERGQTLWAAVSRAVRVPTRIERDVAIDATDPAGNPVLRLLGNRDFGSEVLLAYEAGYRWQVSGDLSLDLTAFHNEYDRLASLELGTPFVEAGSGKTIVPVVNENLTDGHANGVEMQAAYSPVQRWQLVGNYSYLSLRLEPRGLDLNHGKLYERATPRHEIGLRSLLDVSDALQIDAQLRHLSATESSTGSTPAYTELDLRLAWRALERVELSLVGQNLLHDHHAEFPAPPFGSIERGVFGRVELRY